MWIQLSSISGPSRHTYWGWFCRDIWGFALLKVWGRWEFTLSCRLTLLVPRKHRGKSRGCQQAAVADCEIPHLVLSNLGKQGVPPAGIFLLFLPHLQPRSTRMTSVQKRELLRCANLPMRSCSDRELAQPLYQNPPEDMGGFPYPVISTGLAWHMAGPSISHTLRKLWPPLPCPAILMVSIGIVWKRYPFTSMAGQMRLRGYTTLHMWPPSLMTQADSWIGCLTLGLALAPTICQEWTVALTGIHLFSLHESGRLSSQHPVIASFRPGQHI